MVVFLCFYLCNYSLFWVINNSFWDNIACYLPYKIPQIIVIIVTTPAIKIVM